jgi:hypothetical protein
MHFTYTDTPNPYALSQGDLLKRTPALNEVLAAIFPHYHANPVNKFFLVLTQSCDLVIRGERCKSRYITIAAVRPLSVVIDRELQRFQRHPLERALKFCSRQHFGALADLMERLLNNNESQYFYLRRDPFAGLAEDHCAFLQLSVPLKAELHYQTLLAAKIAQLSEPFEHKLAYLVGNLFGRVGTEDWLPHHATPEEFEALRTEPLESAAAWIPPEAHAKVLKILKGLPPAEQTEERLHRAVEEVLQEREGRLADALDQVAAVLSNLNIPDDVIVNARKHLRNRSSFTARIK